MIYAQGKGSVVVGDDEVRQDNLRQRSKNPRAPRWPSGSAICRLPPCPHLAPPSSPRNPPFLFYPISFLERPSSLILLLLGISIYMSTP